MIEEEAQNHDWTADAGPTLKMIGEVILAQWHDANGLFLSSEERKERGKRPQAEVMQSDIQVRIGNRLITLEPADEGKAMISIPVGLSDKATPATIPREWLVGVFIDSMIEAFEGDATVVRYLANGVNAAINNAMEVSDDGRMKINQKKLPEFNNPIEVAEMLESFKRTFVSKSKPSTKANFTMVVQELEPVEEAPQEVEVVEHTPSQADLVMQLADNLASHSTPQEEQEVGEDLHSYTEPVHALEEAETLTPPADDAEEVVAVAADPTPPVDENPHNFKKNPTDWIKHELVNDKLGEHMWSIEEVAGIAGCHVQTIKRALDKFEAEAAYVHMQALHTLKNADETPGWVQLDVVIDDEYELIITCERSATGRYARGRPITFTVQERPTDQELVELMVAQDALEEATFDSIPIEALEDAPPTLKATDDTDPSLSPCPDCGSLTSPADVPKEAPDFICGDCHLIRLDEDEQWAEESRIRAEQNAIYEGKVIDGVPVPRHGDEPEEDEDEEVVAHIVHTTPPATEETLAEAPSILEEVMSVAPREEVEAEWEELMKDSEPYEFPALPEVIDTPVAAIEGTTGRCVVSAEPGKFIANTAIGERWFASEKYWAEYTGNPVMPEGHYGLQAQHDEEVEMQLEAQEESRLRAEDQFNLHNSMGF